LDRLPGPPWLSTAGEQVVADGSAFNDCKTYLSVLSSRPNAEVLEERFSHDPRWGDILRAKVVTTVGEARATTLFICWDNPVTGIHVTITPETMFPY